jgi:hypothetical protein
MSRFIALLALVAISSAVPAFAQAQSRGDRLERLDKYEDSRRDDRRKTYDRPSEPEIPLPRLIRMVERATGGEYVNSDPRIMGGRKYYWMRFRFPGGRSQDYMVDAATGQF